MSTPPKSEAQRKKAPSHERLAIAAVNAEARRRKMTYGKLVGLLDRDELRKIVKSYIKRQESGAAD